MGQPHDHVPIMWQIGLSGTNHHGEFCSGYDSGHNMLVTPGTAEFV